MGEPYPLLHLFYLKRFLSRSQYALGEHNEIYLTGTPTTELLKGRNGNCSIVLTEEQAYTAFFTHLLYNKDGKQPIGHTISSRTKDGLRKKVDKLWEEFRNKE